MQSESRRSECVPLARLGFPDCTKLFCFSLTHSKGIIAKKGINLDRRQIQLHEPLKTLGEFTVPVKLHKDVTAHLKVVIEKEAVAE
ncbi:MAG: 50S ribosomal L9 C-terminal domain-containing protein [Candidatus Sulfotelmatobacter sp.]